MKLLMMTPLVFLVGCSTVLEKVNRDINTKVEYVSDKKAHGVLDCWQTPEETLLLGTGDCEDIALLKAATLHRKYNIPEESMFILFLYDAVTNEQHAVLEVNKQILDNKQQTLYNKQNLRESVFLSIPVKHFPTHLKKCP